METNTYPVKGLHCTSCAQIVKSRLEKLPGVKQVDVNYASEEAKIQYEPNTISLPSINTEIEKYGYSLVYSEQTSETAIQADYDPEEAREKDGFYIAVPIAVFVFVTMIYSLIASYVPRLPALPLPMHIMDVFLLLSASVIMFGPGRRFLTALKRFARYRVANMDTLVGLGTATAYFYSLFLFLFPLVGAKLGLASHYYFDATIVVIGFIILGKYLEKNAKRRSGAAIEALMNLRPDLAYIQKKGGDEEIATANIKVHDRIIVKPGMKIPVDGTVVEGHSSVDESMISGEAMPADKTVGDKVIGGTINRQGLLIVKAESVGADTVLAHIIKLVKEAQNSRSPIQNLSDKISAVFVPIVLVIALVSFLLWIFIGPYTIGFENAMSGAIAALVGVLVIACPCALGLATPTALMAAIGRGAKQGILIKNAEALEKLRETDIVVMDKTGTVTSGNIKVTAVNVVADNKSEDDILLIASALEQYSEHPLAEAIVNEAKTRKLPYGQQLVAGFQAQSGHGVSGRVNDTNVKIGKSGEALGAWATARNDQGETIIDVSIANKLIGQIACGDEIKEEAIEAIKALKKNGLKIMMLTGDRANAAARIARLAGIDEVRANMLPENKASVIRELQAQGHKVAMLGDGINDAPALAQADSGIAMATGTDAAMSTAGITILGGDLKKAVQAYRLSRLTFRTIKENLFWAFIYNIVGIPLAAGLLYPIFGLVLNPAFAGAAMAFSSISVVLNSLRLKNIKL
ncbi:MAG: heavy metal translocating P-type ATPase [bacterium]|nr:heavy metal translocating P-type ATPase [bacterium]